MADDTVRDIKTERLARALRENLKRRKAQARGRAAEDRAGKTGSGPAETSAGTESKD
ncbi:MAG: hypothetical protein NT037_09770 [Hyphomicrobiales bacterium]|jgi:hypothetical protein|nr:hypothetical protein [Hyphomicrobiales bacterium]